MEKFFFYLILGPLLNLFFPIQQNVLGVSCQVKTLPQLTVDKNGIEVLHEQFSTWGSFAINLTNNDSVDCGTGKYIVGVTTPTGWTSSIDPGSLFNLDPQNQQIIKVFLTIPQSAVAGNYSVTANVTNTTTNYSYSWTWYVVVKDNPPGTDTPTPTSQPTSTPIPSSNTTTTTTVQYIYPTNTPIPSHVKVTATPTKKPVTTPTLIPTSPLTPIQRLRAGIFPSPTPTRTPDQEMTSEVSDNEVPAITFRSILLGSWSNLYNVWKHFFTKENKPFIAN